MSLFRREGSSLDGGGLPFVSGVAHFQCVDCIGVNGVDGAAAGYGHVEVSNQAVFEAVYPAVYGEFLFSVPCVFDEGAFAEPFDLFDDVEFAQLIEVGLFIAVFMLAAGEAMVSGDLVYGAYPCIGQAYALTVHGHANTRAAIMAANNNVFDFEYFDCELCGGLAVEVAVEDLVGDVAMNEYFAWL